MRQFSQKILWNLMVVASIFSTSSTGYAKQPQASQVYGMPTEAPLEPVAQIFLKWVKPSRPRN